MRRSYFGLSVCFGMLAIPASAFNTSQHTSESKTVISQLGSSAPDVQKFANSIKLWSAGLGPEALAHTPGQDQTVFICNVADNGGDFQTVIARARTQYKNFNFTSNIPGHEGAYVLLGTAVHLIEDQASMPHGANVHHGSCVGALFGGDNFEGLFKNISPQWTGSQGNVAYDQAYAQSLAATQAQIPSLTVGTTRYWYFNDDLYSQGVPGKSPVRYTASDVPPAPESKFGAYGGSGYHDVYSDASSPTLYPAQVTQATDYAYYFLLNFSKSLAPISGALFIGGSGPAGVPVINSQTGNAVAFRVSENLGPNVSVKVYVDGDTSHNIITNGASIELSGLLSQSGAAQSSSIVGTTIWNAVSASLFATNASNEDLLPYDAFFNMTWKGDVNGSALTDGTHTLCVTATDSDGNTSDSTCSSFQVDSAAQTNPSLTNTGHAVTLPFTTISSTYTPVVIATNTNSGICSISYTSPAGSSTFTFTGSSVAVAGPISLAAGANYVTVTNCAGTSTTSSFTVTSGGYGVRVCVTSTGEGTTCGFGSASQAQLLNSTMTATVIGYHNPNQCNPTRCAEVVPSCSSASSCSCGTSDATYLCDLGSGSAGFTITNTSNTTSVNSLGVTVGVAGPLQPAAGASATLGDVVLDPNEEANVTIELSEVGNFYSLTSPSLGLTWRSLMSFLKSIAVALINQYLTPAIRHNLVAVGTPFGLFGSDFVYTSTNSINITLPLPSGINIDTTTLALYRFDGDWTRLSTQSVNVDGSNVVSATGTITQSGVYGLFFVGIDTTSPISQFSVSGSSSNFDGTLFVSTFSYAVLTATDVVVNGFASQVATTVYRLDPTGSSNPYYAYISSIPLPLGTHLLQYYSYDWAGNTETVRSATFTVTSGTGFRNSTDHRIIGNLLVGFLGFGAQAEIISAAEKDYTLIVSSVNRSPMLTASNIGSVAAGSQTPEGRLDLGQSGTDLLLRSGNATSTGTALQMTFGSNGDYSMRHAFRTAHSTSADGNRMDFLVWSPALATTTVATNKVLSLQAITTASGGSFHVMPAGEPDAEVEVSDGNTTGGGTIQRLQYLTPSSRRYKSDISYLDEKKEDAALDEVAGLQHVRFRYKSRDGRQPPLMTGLVYEDTPESIHSAQKTISSVERMAEVEMALKAALRKLEGLERRYAELKKKTGHP